MWNHAAIEVVLHCRVERNSRIVALENDEDFHARALICTDDVRLRAHRARVSLKS